MNSIDEIEIFNRNKSTLKKTSYDDANKEYMSDFELEVIDLDKVKEEYCGDLKLKESPKSCDALYIAKDEIIFIEFKNCKVAKYEVRKKIYDSILIFTDLVGCGISYTRDKVKYILVYNEMKNQNNRECIDNPKRNIPLSEGLNEFSKGIGKLANEEILRFDLGDFKNYLLRSIHTYTKKEFEDRFVRKINL